MTAAPDPRPTVAILVWGDAIEDFINPIGLSLKAFATEMTGGWLYGYAESLRRVGVRTVVVCVSRAVRNATRFQHDPTGSTVWALPLPRRYRLLRKPIQSPYAMRLEDAFPPDSRIPRPVRQILRDAAPFAALPPLALARVLRRENVDALLVQEYESARFDVAVAVGRALNVPVSATFQGGTWHVSRFERVTRPRSLRAARGLVIASADEAKRVRHAYGVPDHEIAHVFNPLDLDEWTGHSRAEARQTLGLSDAAEVVAWHGRVELHRKGLDVLLDAWDDVVAARPGRDLRLRLMGTGASAVQLHARLDADLPRGVEWHDEYVLDRSVLHRHLAAADVYALPSRHEGFPVALVEALASGLPAVAADAPGVRDVFGSPPAGLVVPTGDAPALAKSLGQLLDDADLRGELAHLGRARAEDAFAPEGVGLALREFLLGGQGVGSGRAMPIS